MVTNLLVPDELQFSIFKIKLIHYSERMVKVAADAVTDYSGLQNKLSKMLAVQFGADNLLDDAGHNPIVTTWIFRFARMKQLHGR